MVMVSRIVMIGDSLGAPGGISSVLRTYRDSGAFSAWNIAFISNYDGSGLARQLLVMLRAIASFIFLLLFSGVSLVHIHSASRGSFWRAMIFSHIARTFRKPYLIHIHSGEFVCFFDRCRPIGKRIIKSTLTRAACVICVSPGWAKLFERIAPDAVMQVLPNPVDVPQEMPVKVVTDCKKLLFLGRLNEKKGLL